MSNLHDCDYCGESDVSVSHGETCSKVCKSCQEHIEDDCATCDDGRLCNYCNGTGEGYAPDSTCSSCCGSGMQSYSSRRREEAELRADYMFDQWKDERNS